MIEHDSSYEEEIKTAVNNHPQKDAIQPLLDAGVNMYELRKMLKLSPSKVMILNMPYDILLKHHALIVHKASSLSSAQRKMVWERVSYALNKKIITPETVAKEVNDLNKFLQGQLLLDLKRQDVENKIKQSKESETEQ